MSPDDIDDLDIDDLLIEALDQMAEHEGLPPDWRDWAYWSDEKQEQFAEGPYGAYSFERCIRDIQNGEYDVQRKVFVDLLLDQIFHTFHTSRYNDVRNHPLWELALRISRHPDLDDDNRREFLLTCSDRNLYLKVFVVEGLVREDPQGGKTVRTEISVPENVHRTACDRAREFMDSKSYQLAEQYNFSHDPSFEVLNTPRSEWTSKPKENAPPRILSHSRVE
jgi:hypothetical protein